MLRYVGGRHPQTWIVGHAYPLEKTKIGKYTVFYPKKLLCRCVVSAVKREKIRLSEVEKVKIQKVRYLIQRCSTMNTFSGALYNLGSGS